MTYMGAEIFPVFFYELLTIIADERRAKETFRQRLNFTAEMLIDIMRIQIYNYNSKTAVNRVYCRNAKGGSAWEKLII